MSVNLPRNNSSGVNIPGKKNNVPPVPSVNEPQPVRPNTPTVNSPKNPSPLSNTPGPEVVKNYKERSASKYLEENSKEEAELQALKQEAAEVFKVKGPLCDSEGFYQHSGECWNDAIQQIFCNADGIKELMQYAYIHWSFNTDYYTQLNDLMFIPSYLRTPGLSPDIVNSYIFINKKYIDELKKWFNLYMRESQKRFIRHYLLETKRRNVKKEVCALGDETGEIAREKIKAISRDPTFRKGGLQAQRSAIYGRSTNIANAQVSAFIEKAASKPTRETYIKEKKKLAGGLTQDEDYIIDLYNLYFFSGKLKIQEENIATLHAHITDIPEFKATLESTTGVFFSISKIKEGELKGSGHALAFYTCGKESLFYEDNYGIAPFPWKQYILKFVELSAEDVNPRMEFVTIHISNKEYGIFYYSPFFPILSYIDKEGKFHNLLFLDDKVIDTNEGKQLKYTFKTSVEGFTIKLDYDRNNLYIFKRFVFFQPPSGSFVTNVGFNQNTFSARIGISPIFRALMNKDEEAALEAIDAEKVIPDLKFRIEGSEDLPVLHSAIRRFNENKVALKLIEKGYNIYSVYDEVTVMGDAILNEKLEVVKALLQKDPSLLEKRDEFGRAPLSISSIDDTFLESTKFLIDQGATIDPKTLTGRTPLYFAAREGAFETVKYLCSKGADPTIIDKGNPKNGQPPMTPIQVAKTPEIKEFLMNQCGKKGGHRRSKKTRKLKRK